MQVKWRLNSNLKLNPNSKKSIKTGGLASINEEQK